MTLSPPKQQQQHLQNVIYFHVNIKYLIKKNKQWCCPLRSSALAAVKRRAFFYRESGE